MMHRHFFLLLIPILILIVTFTSFGSQEKTESITKKNLPLIKSVSTITGIPWEYLAAIHQYEENVYPKRKKEKASSTQEQAPLVSIRVPSHLWSGATNSIADDTNPNTIRFFEGIGIDANGDKVANPKSPQDVLNSVALYLVKNGKGDANIRSQIWNYYHNTVAVDIISHIADIFKKYQTIDLNQRMFPIPLHYDYSYKSTWGDPRGFGGARIHEGTDIFANYGTPIHSTCYGYVELIGWNRFGGWRVGIRDIQNNYHYFAHLSYFRKGLKKGDIVKAGEVIGAVGSSGYGPPGTCGKFPPHLHFGIYSFNGKSTYSYDPYPRLKIWERKMKKNKKRAPK